MDKHFKDVQVLIWDFDGTFYKPNPTLWKAVRTAEYKVIMVHTGWSQEKTIKEFDKLYKVKFSSATQTAAHLAGIPIAQAAIEMEKYFDRVPYLEHDQKLVQLFEQLNHYRHLTLANGVIANHKKALIKMGIDPNIFELMVTSETVGVTKPDLKGFQYILDYTKLAPDRHLMIGDREQIDLVPAKHLGMKTCLVWTKPEYDVADLAMPTVYDLGKVLI